MTAGHARGKQPIDTLVLVSGDLGILGHYDEVPSDWNVVSMVIGASGYRDLTSMVSEGNVVVAAVDPATIRVLMAATDALVNARGLFLVSASDELLDDACSFEYHKDMVVLDVAQGDATTAMRLRRRYSAARIRRFSGHEESRNELRGFLDRIRDRVPPQRVPLLSWR